MNGKIVIVTGANTGLGKETARELARMGATVAMVCRSETKGEAARQEIMADTGSDNIALYLAEFGSLSQVRAVAKELQAAYPVIDVLVNNVGILLPERLVSDDGHEMTFAVNHLAPFLLTSLLLENIKAAPAGRIVNVSSEAHKMGKINRDDLMLSEGYGSIKAYGQAKLANILFTRELARRLDGSGVSANAVHPGVVATKFGRDMTGVMAAIFRVMKLFMIGPAKGARTSIYLASSAEVEGITGEYFVKRAVAKSTPLSRDPDLARWLWEESKRLVGESGGGGRGADRA